MRRQSTALRIILFIHGSAVGRGGQLPSLKPAIIMRSADCIRASTAPKIANRGCGDPCGWTVSVSKICCNICGRSSAQFQNPPSISISPVARAAACPSTPSHKRNAPAPGQAGLMRRWFHLPPAVLLFQQARHQTCQSGVGRTPRPKGSSGAAICCFTKFCSASVGAAAISPSMPEWPGARPAILPIQDLSAWFENHGALYRQPHRHV